MKYKYIYFVRNGLKPLVLSYSYVYIYCWCFVFFLCFKNESLIIKGFQGKSVMTVFEHCICMPGCTVKFILWKKKTIKYK